MTPELRAALDAIGVRETDANGKPDPVWAAFAALGQGGLSPDQAKSLQIEVRNTVAIAMRGWREAEWRVMTLKMAACCVCCGALGFVAGMMVML